MDSVHHIIQLDKVAQTKDANNNALPNTAVAATYDYYPFGMLMPERYTQTSTTQCIPYTQTVYNTSYVSLIEEDVKILPINPGTFNGNNGTTFIANDENGAVKALTTNVLAPISFSTTFTNITPGKLYTLTTTVSKTNLDNMTATLQVQKGNEVWANITTLPVEQHQEDLKFEYTALDNDNLRINYEANAYGKTGASITVKSLNLVRQDKLQSSNIVMLCEQDEGFENSYRFGLHGHE